MPDNHNAILPLFSPMAEKPQKKYPTIVADPPWSYRAKNGAPNAKGPEGQYPTMTMDELYMLPVGGWAADSAHLYLWTTNTFLVEAHRLAEVWGFKPNTVLTWVKGRVEGGRLIQQIGLGSFFRTATEHVVFAVRGDLVAKGHDITTAFVSPRTGHSEKPQAFYDIVERMSYGPYLDVFARKQRLGWDTFGNESFNFGTELPPERFVGAS